MIETPFATELRELYDGELLGEAFFESLLVLYTKPMQQYKLCVALQLESETKARLRPYLLSAGLGLNDNGDARKTGYELASGFEGKSWVEAMQMLVQILLPAVERYRQIVDQAPQEYKALAVSMLEHEEALLTFAERELKGDETDSLREMASQLVFDIPEPLS